jgi:hypothetical protein
MAPEIGRSVSRGSQRIAGVHNHSLLKLCTSRLFTKLEEKSWAQRPHLYPLLLHSIYIFLHIPYMHFTLCLLYPITTSTFLILASPF